MFNDKRSVIQGLEDMGGHSSLKIIFIIIILEIFYNL